MREDTNETLTARARLRRAAMRLFAENGFRGTSVRAIAAAAGVSPALITHHFGSKERLQAAVDDEVFNLLKNALGSVDNALPPKELMEAYGRTTALMFGADQDLRRYLRRALLEDSKAGRALFARMADGTRDLLNAWRRIGVLREDVDEDWAPFQLMLFTIGPLLLEPLLPRNAYDDQELQRRSAANQRLLLHGLWRQDPEAVQTFR